MTTSFDQKTLQFVNKCNGAFFHVLDCEIMKEGDCEYVASGLDSPFLNGVVSGKLDDAEMEEGIDRISDYFKEKELAFSWWSEITEESPALSKELEKRGKALLGTYPGMILNVDRVKVPAKTPELKIQPVKTKEELEQWAAVIATAFHFTDELANAYTNLLLDFGFQEPLYHMSGTVDGETVCTGSLLSTPDGAYIYNIATHENARKRGCGSRITYALIELAKSLGNKQVALGSSPEAVSVYQGLGFSPVTQFHLYA